LISFGNEEDAEINRKLPFKTKFTGSVSGDVNLAKVYNQSDILVLPSLQDNLPNTIMESLSCGKPVIAFDTGGVPDMIEDGYNGFLVKLGNPDDLAHKIRAINNNDVLHRMSKNARKSVVERYSYELIGSNLWELYQKYLSK